MEREFANQFQELTRVDLTTVHHELQQIKDKCDNFSKNLHRAGAIDDSMLFHVIGLKEREQKYHKCSENSAKYFSDLVTAYAYPLFKTHKLPQESLQSAGHITTSRFTAFLEHLLQPVSVEFCKCTINEFCKDSKHYLQDLCEWKKNYHASNIRNNDPLYLVAADVCALYPSIKRETEKMALELALKEHSKFNLSGQRILVNLAL